MCPTVILGESCCKLIFSCLIDHEFWGKSATAVLLNERSNQMTPGDMALHRQIPHSALIREASCSVNGNEQGVKDFGALSPKWGVLIKALPLRIGDEYGREGGQIVRFRQGGCTQELTETVSWAQGLRELTSENPHTKKGKRTRSPIPSQEVV